MNEQQGGLPNEQSSPAPPSTPVWAWILFAVLVVGTACVGGFFIARDYFGVTDIRCLGGRYCGTPPSHELPSNTSPESGSLDTYVTEEEKIVGEMEKELDDLMELDPELETVPEVDFDLGV